MRLPNWRIQEMLQTLLVDGAMDDLPPKLQEYVERAADRFEEKGEISTWDFYPVKEAYELVTKTKVTG